VSALETVCKLKTTNNTETGYKEFFINNKKLKIKYLLLDEKLKIFSNIRLTLDYSEDLQLAKEIFKLSSLMTLFYLLTAVIPFLYILLGILRKNAILFRVGLLALAFSIFTFKYYFSVDYTEFLLTGTGIILILLAKLGTHYLKTPKYGFTIENLFKGDFDNAFNLDDMLIGKSLGTTPFPK
ncbi:hypothetical protein IH922_06370, partial [candidate division KSB1 bacterium]|nr:hypothetical protein [candidate division KSB1 bacterium]